MSYLGQVNHKGDYDGFGKYVWEDGSSYIGLWENGEFNGPGTYVWPDGDKYIGDWIYSRRTGQGMFVWINGDIYQGHFLNGKRHGEGTQWHADGNKYQGQWFDGERHGRGLFYIAASKAIYDVNWENGHAMGYGRFMTADKDIYEGYFNNGKRHGEGTFTWADGSRIAGYWQNGVRDDTRVKDLPPNKSDWAPPDSFLNSKPLPISHYEPPAPPGWDSNQPILLSRPKFSESPSPAADLPPSPSSSTPSNHGHKPLPAPHQNSAASSTVFLQQTTATNPNQTSIPQKESSTKHTVLMAKRNSQSSILSSSPKLPLTSVSTPPVPMKPPSLSSPTNNQQNKSLEYTAAQDPNLAVQKSISINNNGIQPTPQNEKHINTSLVLPIKTENNDLEKNAIPDSVEEGTKPHKATTSSIPFLDSDTSLLGTFSPRLKGAANATANATVTATKTLKKKLSKVLAYKTPRQEISPKNNETSPKNNNIIINNNESGFSVAGSNTEIEVKKEPSTEGSKKDPEGPIKKPGNLDKMVRSIRTGSAWKTKKETIPMALKTTTPQSSGDLITVTMPLSQSATPVETPIASSPKPINNLKISKSAPLPTPPMSASAHSMRESTNNRRKNLPPTPGKGNKISATNDFSNLDNIDSIQISDLPYSSSDIEDEFDLLHIDSFIDKRIGQIPTIPENVELESNADPEIEIGEIGNIIPLIPINIDIEEIDLDNLSTTSPHKSSISKLPPEIKPIQNNNPSTHTVIETPIPPPKPHKHQVNHQNQHQDQSSHLPSQPPLSIHTTDNTGLNTINTTTQNRPAPVGQIEIPKDLEEQIKNFEKMETINKEEEDDNSIQLRATSPVNSYVPRGKKGGHLTKFFDELKVDFDFDALK